MILGTCNLLQTYNGVELNKKESLNLIDKFYEYGGRKLDTAFNYRSHEIIKEWLKQNPNSGMKVITKIWKQSEFWKCFIDLEVDHIYCVLGRENNLDMREFLKDQQVDGVIDKWGMSLYLPQEMNKSYVNVLQIPCDPTWFDYIESLSLYADIYIRSYYNLWLKKGFDKDENNVKRLNKIMENPKVDFVVGCDNQRQLKINMEKFNW